MGNVLSKLGDILTKKDKKLLWLLLFFSIFVSMIETIGISAIMPFLTVAMDFTKIHSSQYCMYAYNLLGCTSDVSFVLFFGIALMFFYVFRGGINIFYTYSLAKFSQGRYHFFAYRLFENYMGMHYRDFVSKNSSNLSKSIISEALSLTMLISSVLFMMSEVFVVLFIYVMMLWVNYKITMVLTSILVLNAILMIKTVSTKIKTHGDNRAELQKNFYEIINKSLSNFKFIKLQANDKNIVNEFKNASYGYAKSNVFAQTLQQVPRLFLEVVAFSLVILMVLYIVWQYQENISFLLSVLSMFVLSLYRLMPSVSRIMTSYNTILFTYKSLEIIHTDLMYDGENLGNNAIDFNEIIKLKDIDFAYETGKPILDHVEIEIKKGESIAFVGESGSGKSTLVDLIIGLYRPLKGQLIVDDEEICNDNIASWRRKIGYIPQAVYLFDGTVAENVVFGESYDEDRLIEVLQQAKIYDFLQTKEGVKTFVGEGGIMLSGGQKQRIAIARALYKKPEILVLDEATSALDDETEMQIMDEIYDISKDKTLIIIAHRLSTIKRCQKIYRIENGKIIHEK
ncbi:MAG: ABC transporter ATP-binding protein [Sulfurospirillaceae bacterium]|nr:ABC transporter ATP-binding protein [Sulfurospirillaceae bacterium]